MLCSVAIFRYSCLANELLLKRRTKDKTVPLDVITVKLVFMFDFQREQRQKDISKHTWHSFTVANSNFR